MRSNRSKTNGLVVWVFFSRLWETTASYFLPAEIEEIFHCSMKSVAAAASFSSAELRRINQAPHHKVEENWVMSNFVLNCALAKNKRWSNCCYCCCCKTARSSHNVTKWKKRLIRVSESGSASEEGSPANCQKKPRFWFDCCRSSRNFVELKVFLRCSSLMGNLLADPWSSAPQPLKSSLNPKP